MSREMMSPLAGSIMIDGVDPFLPPESMEHMQFDDAILRRQRIIFSSEIVPSIQIFLSGGTNEERQDAYAKLSFALWGIYRLKNIQTESEYPWEQSWLASQGQSEWTPNLIEKSPSQYEMAHTYFSNLLIPADVLDSMDLLHLSQKEHSGIQGVKKIIHDSTSQFLASLPTDAMITFGMEALSTTFANSNDSIRTIVTSALYPLITQYKAQHSSVVYHFANQMRVAREYVTSVLKNFFDSPLRQQLLSETMNIHDLDAAHVVSSGLSAALDEHAFTTGLLQFKSTVHGQKNGGILASAAFLTPFPFFYTQASTRIGELLRTRIASRNIHEIAPSLTEKHARVREAAYAYLNLPESADIAEIQKAEAKIIEAGNTRNLSLLRTNQQTSKDRAWFKSLPSSIALLLSATRNDELIQYVTPVALTSGSMLTAIGDSTSMLVMRSINRADTDAAYTTVRQALTHLTKRFGELHLPPPGTDYGPLPNRITVTINRTKNGQLPVFSQLQLDPGITVLTGETGKGKSTVMDIIHGIHALGNYATINAADMNDIRNFYAYDRWQRRVKTVSVNFSFGSTLSSEITRKIVAGEHDGIQRTINDLLSDEHSNHQYLSHLLDLLTDPLKNHELATVLESWKQSLSTETHTEQTQPLIAALNAVIKQYFSQFFDANEHDRIDQFMTTTFSTNMAASTGQRARIGLALSLMSDADMYLFDEISGNLDTKTTVKIADILLQFIASHKQSKFILSIHDPIFLNKIWAFGPQRIYDFDTSSVWENSTDVENFVDTIQSRILQTEQAQSFTAESAHELLQALSHHLDAWDKESLNEYTLEQLIHTVDIVRVMLSKTNMHVLQHNINPSARFDEYFDSVIAPIHKTLYRIADTVFTKRIWELLKNNNTMPWYTLNQIHKLVWQMNQIGLISKGIIPESTRTARDYSKDAFFNWQDYVRGKRVMVKDFTGLANHKYQVKSLFADTTFERNIRHLRINHLAKIFSDFRSTPSYITQTVSTKLLRSDLLSGLLSGSAVSNQSNYGMDILGQRVSRLVAHLLMEVKTNPVFAEETERIIRNITTEILPDFLKQRGVKMTNVSQWMSHWVAQNDPRVQSILLTELPKYPSIAHEYISLLKKCDQIR